MSLFIYASEVLATPKQKAQAGNKPNSVLGNHLSKRATFSRKLQDEPQNSRFALALG